LEPRYLIRDEHPVTWIQDPRQQDSEDREEDTMKWTKPSVQEVCVGMEVTSYESAEIDPVLI
jgi:coenzyme PQQ precursor peptide PqqA